MSDAVAADDDGQRRLAPAVGGRPITATSGTPGWARMTFSISAGYTFSPPVMIMSLIRSLDVDEAVVVDDRHVAGVEPAVDVVSAVASGRFQYPVMMAAPADQLARLPGRDVLPSSSTTRTSVWKNALPVEPARCQRVVGADDAGRAAALGEPVDLVDLDADLRVGLDERRRARARRR